MRSFVAILHCVRLQEGNVPRRRGGRQKGRVRGSGDQGAASAAGDQHGVHKFGDPERHTAQLILARWALQRLVAERRLKSIGEEDGSK